MYEVGDIVVIVDNCNYTSLRIGSKLTIITRDFNGVDDMCYSFKETKLILYSRYIESLENYRNKRINKILDEK
jgi:hypothetical protein